MQRNTGRRSLRLIVVLLSLCQFSEAEGNGKNIDKSFVSLASGKYDFQMGLHYFTDSDNNSVGAASDFELARKHLLRRATVEYENEDMNEKWQSLYLLGNLLTRSNNPKDNAEALHWFNLCKKFNSDLMDCSVSLAELYLSVGHLSKSKEEVMYMASSVASSEFAMAADPRADFIRRCLIPSVAIDVFDAQVRTAESEMSIGEAKYFLLLILMVKDRAADICRLHDPRFVLPDSAFALKDNSTVESLCEDADVLDYFLENGIVMHPCPKAIDAIHTKNYCGIKEKDISLQLLSSDANGAPMGAANLLDIVHHVYGGDSSHIFRTVGDVHRVLFAGSFTARNVFHFTRQLQALESDPKFNPTGDFDDMGIHRVMVYVIVDSDAAMSEVNSFFSRCHFHTPRYIQFVSSSTLLSLADVEGLRFDFIEYADDLSLREHYSASLNKLRDLLTPSGVIGISVFSENTIVNKIRKLLFRGDRAVHLPFSADAVKFVADFLISEGYSNRAKQDLRLLQYIATMPSHMGGTTWQKSWTAAELSATLSKHGLSDVSFLPAYMNNPYDELSDQPAIQKWKSMGLRESDFIEEFISPFRYTVYAARSGANLPGRPDFLRDDFPQDTVFVDRSMGSLAETFAGMHQQADSFQNLRVPLMVHAKLNSEMKEFGFVKEENALLVYLSAEVAAVLSLLPNVPTLLEMEEALESVALKNGDTATTRTLFMQNMENLVRINAISVWKTPMESMLVKLTDAKK